MNLDEYFTRTGYNGTATGDLQSLRDIVLAHATSIPFESLDPVAGVLVSLEPGAILQTNQAAAWRLLL